MKPTEAIETLLPLNLLIAWDKNPRKTRVDLDVIQIATSLSKSGQLQPLIVWKGAGESVYLTIDGETRRCGFNLNAEKGLISPDAEVRTWVLPEDTTEDQLIAVALAANTVRRQMNAIEEMEAYRSLAGAGMKLNAIADLFAIDTRIVRQRLALGDLVESARDLVRAGKRHMGWAQAMTLGSPTSQERIVAEIEANNGAFATGEAVRAELTRGKIPVSSIFGDWDPSELAECLVCDLFEPNGSYFDDATKFWDRQRVAIQAKIDELATTHKEVIFIDRTRFDDAGWTRGGEPSESTAVVIAYDDGTVKIEEGMIPPADHAANDDSDEGSFLADADEHYGREHEGSDGEASHAPAAAPRPNAPNILAKAADDAEASEGADTAVIEKIEVNPLDNATKGTTTYLIAQVAAALKLRVQSDPLYAMAVVVTAAITKRGPVPSLSPSGCPIDAKDQTSAVFKQLDNARQARDRILVDAGIAGMNSPAQVVRKLLGMEGQLLGQVFAYTIADAITTGIDEASADLFDALGAEMLAGWQIEPNYLKDLNNAQIRALAMEVIDLSNQPSMKSSRSQIERAIMEAVTDDTGGAGFMSNSPTWTPPQITTAVQKAADKREAAAAAAAAAEALDKAA